MALAKQDEIEIVVTIRSKNNPQQVVTSTVSQNIHVFNRFDQVQETIVVADEAESAFLKTETALRDAYGKFMNSTIDSDCKDTNSQKKI